MPSSRSVVVMAGLSSKLIPGTMGTERKEGGSHKLPNGWRTTRGKCGCRWQKWERESCFFLAVTHKDVMTLIEVVAVRARKGTLVRMACLVTEGWARNGWVELDGFGWEVMLHALGPSGIKYPFRNFVFNWFWPLNISVLTLDVLHFSPQSEKGRDEEFCDEISISQQASSCLWFSHLIFLLPSSAAEHSLLTRHLTWAPSPEPCWVMPWVLQQYRAASGSQFLQQIIKGLS